MLEYGGRAEGNVNSYRFCSLSQQSFAKSLSIFVERDAI